MCIYKCVIYKCVISLFSLLYPESDWFLLNQFIKLIRPSEKMFKITTVPKCPKKILQFYQADEDLGINFTGKFVVKTQDKTFTTSGYAFLQTDFLADQLLGMPFKILLVSSWCITNRSLRCLLKSFYEILRF